MSLRRFEFVSGSSSKFWQILTFGCQVVVRFGRIGTAGQEVSKTLPSHAAALKHAGKLIEEKTRKGYHEVQTA